jgi:hypothetical protein
MFTPKDAQLSRISLTFNTAGPFLRSLLNAYRKRAWRFGAPCAFSGGGLLLAFNQNAPGSKQKMSPFIHRMVKIKPGSSFGNRKLLASSCVSGLIRD